MKIDKLQAYEILDSRGNPTVEVELTSGKITVSASVPSGASTGIYEAVELRDNDKKRYNGKGVLKAVENVNKKIAKKIVGENIGSQKKLDSLLIALDGAENKSNLGANATLGVSLAFAKAMAKKKNLELYEYFATLASPPLQESCHERNRTGGDRGGFQFTLPAPSFNIINGGKHADSGLDIQEFMIQPVGIKSFKEQLRAGAEIYHALKSLLQAKGERVSVGDEGGFAPRLKSNEEAFELIIEAIKKAGYNTEQIKIGIDFAASSFYKNGKYVIKDHEGNEKILKTKELAEWYGELLKKYPINSIEDGFEENDWKGFKILSEKFGKKILVVGDDLLVTNYKKVKKAVRLKAANSVIIKLNQIGTVTETVKTVKLAKANNISPFASNRSGETEDSCLADLAVGLGCGFIKAGSLSRSERLAKYNRLLKIETLLLSKKILTDLRILG
ncbi:phosphopyruvate hydratase [Candidatus Falkowbacteria bacterium RBG_13_39_14]|uniref:Enolase n=1 Tax=Candidatus Falkowbacteria bacterium RBG_13_39_14 TaxID=1797985 RepID=A0A1F5S7S2_9BACT|nr:MAG: phosphopyruvate hydratase [Candidatus Falkowbacteria bacterium RBG_13_39_14]